VLDRDAYARVVAVMKDCAARFTAEPEPEPPPPASADEFGIGDDEIPF
jgi:hypothetical protein